MSEGDPVSWLMIEPGWTVVGGDGREIGRVEEVVGDSGDDIFNGLAVSTGLLDRRRYVPSEQVEEITQGRVRLALTADQLRHLGEFGEPPASLEIESTEAGLADRVTGAFTDPEHRPRPPTPWRRLLNRIFRR